MAEMDEKQENMWATFCHLGAFAFYFIPFGNIIAPSVIWLLKKDESPLIDDQGKESLNFQISITIYAIVSALLILVVIGIFLLICLWIFANVFVIIAAVKANSGEKFRYPLTIRMV